MKVNIDRLPKSRVRLGISLDKSEMKRYIDLTLKEIAKNYVVKGFRKGEVPMGVLEKNVDPSVLMMEALDKAINDSYNQALEQEKLHPIGQPKVDIPKKDQDYTTKGLSFEIEVDVLPSFKLPDYRKKAKNFPKKDVTVSKKEVEDVVQNILNSRASHQSVAREAKKGDRVKFVVDIVKGKEVVVSDKEYTIDLGDMFQGIQVFHESLEGMKEGESKTFVTKMPKNFEVEDLAGKKVECKIQVKSVIEVILPQWNEDMVKELTGGKFSKVSDMEKNIEEGVLEKKKQAEQVQRVQAFVGNLIKDLEIDLPDVLVDNELQNMLEDLEQKVVMQGLTMEKYYESLGMNEDLYKQEIRPNAEEKLKMMLMFSEIADAEKIVVPEEVLTQEMQYILKSYPKDQIQNLDTDRLRDFVNGDMQDRMVVDFLTNLTQN